MTPRRMFPGDPELYAVLALIREAFAAMDGRVDPPSSMHGLTLDALNAAAGTGEVWVIGAPPLACVLFEAREDCLYLSKLAVAEDARGTGLSRRLVELADGRAEALGLAALELNTRVELFENHSIFARLGFEKTGDYTHAGYDRPTSVTMRKVSLPRAARG